MRGTERQSTSGEGAEREGDTGSKEGICAVSTKPDVGLKPTNVRSSPEPKSDAQPTEPPRHPSFFLLLFLLLFFGGVQASKGKMERERGRENPTRGRGGWRKRE